MSNGTAPAAGADYLHGSDGFGAWFNTRDHKRIGMMFLAWILGAFLIGSIFAVNAKLKLVSGADIDEHVFQQTMTYHGLIMVFAFVVPAIPSVLGFFLLPLQLGAGNMAMPRLSLCSLRAYGLGTLLIFASLFKGAIASGWTLNTPLILGDGGAFTLLAFGLFFMGASWFLTGVNFLVTVHHKRAEGMGFFDMPLMAWGLYLTGYLLTAVGVVFAIIVLYLAAAHAFGRGLFSAETDPLLWSNYFWFVTTPAAFFALLPAVGVISEVIVGISRKAIAGYRTVVGAMIALLGLSFVTWGVHLIGSGQDPVTSFTFAALNVLTVVPVALITYAWLATLHRGAVMCGAPTAYVVSFLLNAGIAAVMGLYLSSLSVGSYLINTAFATAHLHYVMLGGVTSALLAGLHYWWPKMTGTRYHQLLGRISAFLFAVGVNLAFFPRLIMGAKGVAPGAMTTAADVAGLQRLSAMGMGVLGVGLVLAVWNLAAALTRRSAADEPNPWGASTLEWQAASPPPPENFATAPQAGAPYDF